MSTSSGRSSNFPPLAIGGGGGDSVIYFNGDESFGDYFLTDDSAECIDDVTFATLVEDWDSSSCGGIHNTNGEETDIASRSSCLSVDTSQSILLANIIDLAPSEGPSSGCSKVLICLGVPSPSKLQ